MILGDPGSGKSSFTNYLHIYTPAPTWERVIFRRNGSTAPSCLSGLPCAIWLLFCRRRTRWSIWRPTRVTRF